MSKSETSSALWGGRFSEAIADVAHRFSSSIALDGKLYSEDIQGSIAHARMLGLAGIIDRQDSELIIGGLERIRLEIESGEFAFDASMEDVHLAIEQRLTSVIGAAGGKLHTGRSRNDQVAVDERLYLRSAIASLVQQATALQRVLCSKAQEHLGAVMAGYTHMQRAQPVLLSHHLLAYVEMLGRDVERLNDCLTRVNRSPLGAAAFGGTPYPLDRQMTARELGFDSVLQNSIDAVSDRDHLIEVASACSIIMMHLSRMAEELVIWSTKEFGYVSMSDAVTTGSSIMPQKKNPDMAELVRGKVGRVYGSLINLLTIMKGLPLAYNRDMQEDKQPMFDSVETTRDSLEIMTFMIGETTFDTARMQKEVGNDLLSATEIADYLVRKGLPFREAHHVTGAVVAFAIERAVPLTGISIEDYCTFSPLFETDLYSYLDPARSVREKRSEGGTNPDMVAKAIERWKLKLQSPKDLR